MHNLLFPVADPGFPCGKEAKQVEECGIQFQFSLNVLTEFSEYCI